MTEKFNIDVTAIAGANNALDFTNYSKGKEIVTHNVNVDKEAIKQIVATTDEAKTFIASQIKDFETRDGEKKTQLQAKLADDVKIFIGREEVELTANIQYDKHEARLIGVYGRDKTFDNEYIRITAILIKAKSVNDIATAGVNITDDDFDF